MDLKKVDVERLWVELLSARAAYDRAVSPHYDEVLYEISATAAAEGSIGKRDLGALIAWKRLNASTTWVSGLMSLPETRIREITGQVALVANDPALSLRESARVGRAALSSLPGCKTADSYASAILLAVAPTRLAIYDSRVVAALAERGLSVEAGRGVYARYIGLLESLLASAPPEAAKWNPRDLDLAFYQLGG